MAVEPGEATGFSIDTFFADPTTWAGVGLIIFAGIVAYMKAPGMLTKSLDDRAAKITAELATAEALRLEAEAKLADAQRRQTEAEADAAAIVDAARREAAQLAQAASVALADRIARREKMAEDRIARAESDAVRDVKNAAIDTASKAAAAVLVQQLSGTAADAHLAQSLDAVKKALS